MCRKQPFHTAGERVNWFSLFFSYIVKYLKIHIPFDSPLQHPGINLEKTNDNNCMAYNSEKPYILFHTWSSVGSG